MRHEPVRSERNSRLPLASDERQLAVDMTGERWTKTFSLALIGVASFASLLPTVLAAMNALKTTAEISGNRLAPPTRLHWTNFTSSWPNGPLAPGLLPSP